MEATLIYNPNAGGAGSAPLDKVLSTLQAAGVHATHRPTEQESDLNGALADARGVVVVVGGDGTARAVATRLVGRGLPLAILPLGTANNIARSVGLTGAALEIAAGLRQHRRVPFDVGRISAPWGSEYFLEAAGCGLYADALAAYDPDEGKSIPRALSALSGTLSTYSPPALDVELDGQNLSGTYLIAEALNTTATGPRLRLAPRADTHDGLLDVLLADADRQESVLQYLRCLFFGEPDQLQGVRIRRGRRLRIRWTGQAFHVDGMVRPRHDEDSPLVVSSDAMVEIDVLPGALELLIPCGADRE